VRNYGHDGQCVYLIEAGPRVAAYRRYAAQEQQTGKKLVIAALPLLLLGRWGSRDSRYAAQSGRGSGNGDEAGYRRRDHGSERQRIRDTAAARDHRGENHRAGYQRAF